MTTLGCFDSVEEVGDLCLGWSAEGEWDSVLIRGVATSDDTKLAETERSVGAWILLLTDITSFSRLS